MNALEYRPYAYTTCSHRYQVHIHTLQALIVQIYYNNTHTTTPAPYGHTPIGRCQAWKGIALTISPSMTWSVSSRFVSTHKHLILQELAKVLSQQQPERPLASAITALESLVQLREQGGSVSNYQVFHFHLVLG
jgi:hypothetical protein